MRTDAVVARFNRLLSGTQFVERPYFLQFPLCVRDDLRALVGRFSSLERHIFDSTDEGAMKQLFCKYLNDIWISEIPPDTAFNTEEVVEILLEGSDSAEPAVAAALTEQGVTNPARVAKKLVNLHRACETAFGKDFHTPSTSPFDVELAKAFHSVIGAGIIKTPGDYRTIAVQAAQSTVMYALPAQISLRMDTLFQWVRSRVEEANSKSYAMDRADFMFRVGAVFFSEFLLIHPFANGNGRTARLLLSILLLNITTVPLSLSVSSPSHTPRDIYISTLEARNDDSPPSLLATLILRSATIASSTIGYLLEME